MKRLVLIILLVACMANAGWLRTYGGDGYDLGNCVQNTSDGKYIITGYTSNSGVELLLLKVDTTGEVIWTHTTSGLIGNWIEETASGNFVVAACNPNLLLFNLDGDTIWTKDFEMYYAHCVQQISDGGFIIVGSNRVNPLNGRLILVKTDGNGNELWTRSYGELPRNRNRGHFVRQTQDGGYIITGYTGSEYEDSTRVALWLLKTDSEGDTVWTKEYGGDERGIWDEGRCVVPTNDGGYIIIGHHSSPDGLWLLKTDENGDTSWTKIYRTSVGGEGYNVSLTTTGNYIIVGTTETTSSKILQELTGADLWLLHAIEDSRDTSWSRQYGEESGGDIGYCVQPTPDSGYIIVGATSSYGVGPSDVLLLKTDSLGLLSIKENFRPPDGGRNWEVISNLGHQVILRFWNRPNGFNAAIYDVSGRRVDELHQSEFSGYITWGDNYPSGVYFIQVEEKEEKNKSTERVVLTR